MTINNFICKCSNTQIIPHCKECIESLINRYEKLLKFVKNQHLYNSNEGAEKILKEMGEI
jgi:hypothetical protein